MKISELYQNQAARNKRFKELKALGKNVVKRSSGPALIHPQYIVDYTGIEKTDTAVANLVYKMFFPKLYEVREV
jgi:hypothetical protein